VLDVQLNSTDGCNAMRSTAVFLRPNVSGGTKMKETLFRIGAFYLFVDRFTLIKDVV
jgi:hypothetical protein